MKKILLSFILLNTCISAVQAQVLTLKDAISYALEHKSEAIKARLETEKGRYEIAQARANALPNIAINGGITHNIKLQETVLPNFINPALGPMKLTMGQPWTSNAVATLSQVLFNQAVFTGLQAAKTTREFYQINQQLTEEQLIEKVANAYFQVFQARQVLANISSNLELTEKTANTIQGLYNSGLAKKVDLDRTQVALTNLKSARQQAQNGYELSENALKFMIGMPMETPLALPQEAFEPNYGLLFENSGERTELQVLEKQKELLTLSKKATSAGHYPSLVLVANYGFLGQGQKNPLFYGEKDGVYWSDFSSIGLNLSIPIFTGFGTRSKVKKAQIDIDKLQADINNTRLAFDLERKNAQTQLTNSQLTIQSQQENVKLAQSVLENTQNNYTQGLASLTDLLDAERTLSDAKNSYTNAILQYKLAEISLMKAAGKLKELK